MQRHTARTGHLLLLVLLLGAVLLALVLRARGSARSDNPDRRRLVEGVTGMVTRIDPLASQQSAAERSLAALVFAGLTRPGPDGAPLPALAERWTVEQDSRIFTFTLRSGLSWHDGRPITSEDVLFTVEALLARRDQVDPALREVWSSARLTAVGPERVRVDLPAPFSPLPAHAAFGLLPAHLLRAIPFTAWDEHPYFRAPVGAGPFRLRRLTGQSAELDAFAAYALGVPYLPGIDLRFDLTPAQLRQGYAAGEIDATLIASPGENGHVRHLARPAYRVVLLNHADPLLADARVRLALSLALDRAALAMPFAGVPVDVPFAPGWWAAPEEAAPVQDPAAALRWLAEAGYRRIDEGLIGRNGGSLALRLLAPSEGEYAGLAAAIAEAWRALGVEVTVDLAPTERLVREHLMPGNFQGAVVGWDPGPDPDPFGAWHSSRHGTLDGNFGKVRDPELDRLAEAGRAAATLAERAATYAEFAARFRVFSPGIVLFADQWPYALPARLDVSTHAAASDAGRFSRVHLWRVQRVH